MKRKWIAFLLAALAVVSLAGCGETDRKSDSTDSSTDKSYNSTDRSDDVTNPPGSNTDKSDTTQKDEKDGGTTDEKTKTDNTINGSQTPTMNAGGYVEGRANTRTWGQMLDNGTVHDEDGYLLDGENSAW